MAVFVMLCGVAMATVTDVDVSAVGFAIGMTAVLGAAQQQILIGKMQKRLQASVRLSPRACGVSIVLENIAKI